MLRNGGEGRRRAGEKLRRGKDVETRRENQKRWREKIARTEAHSTSDGFSKNRFRRN